MRKCECGQPLRTPRHQRCDDCAEKQRLAIKRAYWQTIKANGNRKRQERRVKQRDAKDYAIEFGGYLAVAVRRYMASVNREIIPEGDTECSEAWRGLESAIYEFEKRVAQL